MTATAHQTAVGDLISQFSDKDLTSIWNWQREIQDTTGTEISLHLFCIRQLLTLRRARNSKSSIWEPSRSQAAK